MPLNVFLHLLAIHTVSHELENQNSNSFIVKSRCLINPLEEVVCKEELIRTFIYILIHTHTYISDEKDILFQNKFN